MCNKQLLLATFARLFAPLPEITFPIDPIALANGCAIQRQLSLVELHGCSVRLSHHNTALNQSQGRLKAEKRVGRGGLTNTSHLGQVGPICCKQQFPANIPIWQSATSEFNPRPPCGIATLLTRLACRDGCAALAEGRFDTAVEVCCQLVAWGACSNASYSS